MDEKKHSGLGIASFIVSLVSGILMFVVIVLAGVIESSSPGGMDEESIDALLIGLGIFGLIATSLLSLGLGIGGLVQKDRLKIFAVLGTVFSVLNIVGMGALMLVGLMVA